jgi:hypothetical protein
MHVCDSPLSEKTLCGLAITTTEINVTAGYKSVCPVCFPPAEGSPDLGDEIKGRNPTSEQVDEQKDPLKGKARRTERT